MDGFLRFGWTRNPSVGDMGEFLRNVLKQETDSRVRALARLLLNKGRELREVRFPGALQAQLDAISDHAIPHYQTPDAEADTQKRLQQVEALAGAEPTPMRDLDLIRVQVAEALHRQTRAPAQREDGYPTPPEILADLRRRNVSISDARFDALFEFVEIEPGDFIMGSPDAVPGGWRDDEIPHPVKITRGFALGRKEVTREVWKEVMGQLPTEPESFLVEPPSEKLPVIFVSWNDANHFVSALTLLRKHKGEVYRLPTEAEWEYAARGGQKVDSDQRQWPFSYGKDGSQAKDFGVVGREAMQPVASRKPNPLGLYDMYGNVWEWVEDSEGNPKDAPYNPTYGHPVNRTSAPGRIIRGGSWLNDPSMSARSASRQDPLSELRNNLIGFRIARTRP